MDSRDRISLAAGLLAVAGVAALSVGVVAFAPVAALAGLGATVGGAGTLAIQRRRSPHRHRRR